MENIIKGAVVVNSFVRRQTKESPFSYYDGDLQDVANAAEYLLKEKPDQVKSGYREGVIILTLLNPTNYYSGVVDLNDSYGELDFVVSFAPRKPGEEAYVDVKVKGPKAPAKVVDLVLYRRDVLEENERSSHIHSVSDTIGGRLPELEYAEWELVSINARATEEEEPMTPVAMMRNMLELPGGTKATYTAEEFCKSIHYWSSRAMAA